MLVETLGGHSDKVLLTPPCRSQFDAIPYLSHGTVRVTSARQARNLCGPAHR